MFEDVATLIEESGLNPAILLESADDSCARASSGDVEMTLGAPVDDGSLTAAMQPEAAVAADSETVPDNAEGASFESVKFSAPERTLDVSLGDDNAMDWITESGGVAKDAQETTLLSLEDHAMEAEEVPGSTQRSDVPLESVLGCSGDEQSIIKEEDTQPGESLPLTTGEAGVLGSGQPFFAEATSLSEGDVSVVKSEPISFECQQGTEDESGAFESDVKVEGGADFLPESAGVSTEDSCSAQFVPCDEDTVIEGEEAALDDVARAAAAPEMVDMDGGSIEFGGESEVFGSHADAEGPFVSFGDPVAPSEARVAGDCSVPVVTTLGLDSLLDDCPDWKTAILDATDTLDDSMQGEGLFTSGSLSAQALADEATAAAAAAAAMAQAEDEGLHCGDGELSAEQLLSDSTPQGEAGREEASLGAGGTALDDATGGPKDE